MNEFKENMEGIARFRAKGKTAPIEITNWADWEHSYWVRLNIRHPNARALIVDSGVIEELADAIRRIRRGKEKPTEERS